MPNSIKVQLKTGQMVLFVLALSLLFLGFYRNQWQMARPKKFSVFQKDVESYVIGRMVLTRQSGIFSKGGLLGWGDVNPNDVNESDYQHQYDTYFDGLSFESYLTKESHPGFQGLFFSILDQLSPFTPSSNLRLFRMLAASLFALTLTGLITWFYEELGALSAIFVLVSTLVSQWMTLFGRNLFFVSGFFYLPMLVLLFRLQKEKNGRPLSYHQLFCLVFAFIVLKCLFNGYDFILPTLGMAASPIVFYGVQNGWGLKKFSTRLLIIVIASLGAILVSLVILSIQVMFASGNLEGLNYIIETINRRTFSNDPSLPAVYETAANASYWSILRIYLSESYFDRYMVPYYAIIILFAIVSVVYFILHKKKYATAGQSSQRIALIITTWFSLLSPLSWYIIFKSVAYFHTHMNYLPWHMPFTLFGFGMCGHMIETTFARLRDQHN